MKYFNGEKRENGTKHDGNFKFWLKLESTKCGAPLILTVGQQKQRTALE